MRYDLCTLADEMCEGLKRAEAALRAEQAVYGLDSMDELKLHELLAEHLKRRFEVAREVHYPSSAGSRRPSRRRCDLVLSESGRPLKRDFEPATLFDPASMCGPSEALWLEIKVAYQYREGGARHGGYSAQWRSAIVEDLKKMEADELIREAALALIVFNESESILEKDLDLFEVVLAQKEVLAGFRQVRTVPILDRIGHRLCSVALWPTVQR